MFIFLYIPQSIVTGIKFEELLHFTEFEMAGETVSEL